MKTYILREKIDTNGRCAIMASFTCEDTASIPAYVRDILSNRGYELWELKMSQHITDASQWFEAVCAQVHIDADFA